MVTEAGSIVSLREYYGDRLHVEDGVGLMAELMGGNDRSAIITVTAICAASLEAKIAANLPGLKDADKKAIDHAFRHDGAFGTLSAQIDAAFYLGLIDKLTQKQAHDLRHIRNAVAHTKRLVSFDAVPLRNAAKRLFHPNGQYKLLSSTSDGYKRTFIAESLFLHAAIVWGREKALEDTRNSFLNAGMPDPFA